MKTSPIRSLKKHPLIAGTMILTITGLISRLIGFFYRIYLSRIFGEEGMGVYQLLGPVIALSFSLTVAGIQTAISKYVACETATGDVRYSYRILSIGLIISLILSFLCTGLLYLYSDWLSVYYLLEPRTASMIRIISLSIPMGAVHSCINGYFYGIKKTAVPSVSQLVEQLVRVGSVAFFCQYYGEKGELSISLAVIGLVFGECASMLVCMAAIYTRFHRFDFSAKAHTHYPPIPSSTESVFRSAILMLKLALPLSANRIVINFLQSIEAIYIPNRLMEYGYTNSGALSIYGVFTGMAMPLILFPNALTGSVSVLLLPMISEADAAGNQKEIRNSTIKTIKYCTFLGFFCLLIFFFMGNRMGILLFHSETAGAFIQTLGFICPFLYLNSTLSSILHGLGKAGLVFLFNILSLSIRLGFVFFTIPMVGITGYFWGILASQMFLSSTYILTLFPSRIRLLLAGFHRVYYNNR